MTVLRGIIPPIITPMNEDESVNEQELRNQVNRLVEAGVHGLFPFGTNGESYILSEKEKEQVLSVVVEENRGRVPVYAGSGCVGTKDTIRMSQMAQSLGADVLSVITPWFAKASDEELYDHYCAVAGAVKIPVILYNIPARTGNSLSPALVARLSRVENIVGVKDSGGNFDNMLQYMEKTREREGFIVLSGNDSLIYWNLLAGGAGGIAGCANVYPETMTAIYERFVKGDLEGARKAQDSIRSFRDCFKYGNPNTIVKTAVAMLGYPVGKCRAPFDQIPPKGIEAIRQVLKENQELGMK
ncbi:MAG: 4-hydroxy-tetrahydrodipicolinate synthase [Hungatella sp.]|nr:4-hydroxy-tetrahydrodipicolinate synthase [Hungatella sp.]